MCLCLCVSVSLFKVSDGIYKLISASTRTPLISHRDMGLMSVPSRKDIRRFNGFYFHLNTPDDAEVFESNLMLYVVVKHRLKKLNRTVDNRKYVNY